MPGRNATRTLLVWGGPLVLLVGARLLLIGHPDARLLVLQATLGLTAVGEGLAAVANVLAAPRFAERNGRPYDRAYHGMMQDFGFYNLAMAFLLGTCAFEPARSVPTLLMVIGLYLLHGITHLLRYAGIYYGGEQSVPTRPPGLELRDGMQLLLPAASMMLFVPGGL